MSSIRTTITIIINLYLFQVQEFEHINGYYSMPEMIRKPVEPVEPVKAEGAGDSGATGTSSTSATPATSNAPSPSPAATPNPANASAEPVVKPATEVADTKEAKEDGKEKEKEVIIRFISKLGKVFNGFDCYSGRGDAGGR